MRGSSELRFFIAQLLKQANYYDIIVMLTNSKIQ